MAEEKSKKKTIVASDGDNDEHDDDYSSCDQDPQETDLSWILDKLSLGEKKEEKKKLLVLSLNGLLLHRVHKKVSHLAPKNRSPDASCGPNLGNIFNIHFHDQEECTDSGYKTLENSYKPLFFKDLSKVFQCFKDPEGDFCSYLDGLAKSSDVQAYIKEHSFGQPKIDSSHPDWSFYRKVAKIVS
ncbi:hypothetical protein CARUB_v10025297mg [Capsella rubella]|uniref:FCP1 homology domain-containing protein n=1 Tax=Capsella rubella TaxID=81985 RepID=R0G0Y2_9BRAS|nr:hypothetical protein CARUB_v10025297mg [Capsella rubella]